jgi:hypothetical protein
MDARRFLLVILGAVVIAKPAAAGNLLPNASFDSDVSGWSGGFAAWSAEDVAGSQSSGSLELQNTDVQGATVGYVCVPVTGGSSYAYGGEYLIEPGQAANGQISMQVRWFSDAACNQFLSLVNPTLDANGIGAWTHVVAIADAPANAQGAYFAFFDMKQGGPLDSALVVHLDDAFLPEPATCVLQLAALGALGVLASRRRAPVGLAPSAYSFANSTPCASRPTDVSNAIAMAAPVATTASASP